MFRRALLTLATIAHVVIASVQPAQAAVLSISWVSPQSGSAQSGVVKFKAIAGGVSLSIQPGSVWAETWCLKVDGAPVSTGLVDRVDYDDNWGYSDLYKYGDYDSSNGCWTQGGYSGYGLTKGAFELDTTPWANGSHYLVVTVTDSLGRLATSSTLTLITNNPAPTFSWGTSSESSTDKGIMTVRADATPAASGTAKIVKWCLKQNGQIPQRDLAPRLNGDTWNELYSLADYDDKTGCWTSVYPDYGLVHGAFEFDARSLAASSIRFNTDQSASINVVAEDTSGRLVNSDTFVFRATGGVISTQIIKNGTVPGFSPEIKVGARTTTSVAVTVAAPTQGVAAVTEYVFRYSQNLGADWKQVTSQSESYTFINLPSASSLLVNAAAINAAGQGPWGPVTLLTTKGARPNRVVVTDSLGQPVSGGTITWSMVNESTRSARLFGLTSDGVIDFPATPAGLVDVTIKDAELMDGTTVSGTTRQYLGFPITKIRLPAHSAVSRTVRVLLPDSNVGISNVSVMASKWLDDSEAVNEYTFEYPDPISSGTTDQLGRVVLWGFDHEEGTTVSATYDDTLINQTKTAALQSSGTDIELDYVPWFSFANTSLTGSVGKAIPVVVNLNDSEITTSFFSAKSFKASALGAGQSVRLIAPPGAKTGACGAKGAYAKLSGVVDAKGKVSLKVCATVSGTYKLKASGAAATGYLNVLVAGAAPLPVNSASVASKNPGELKASWNAPTYLGGAPLLDYTVTIKSGSRTVTKVTKTKTITVSGLNHATDYVVTIRARTKFGYSPSVVEFVRVA
jgi:hypothetical protein